MTDESAEMSERPDTPFQKWVIVTEQLLLKAGVVVTVATVFVLRWVFVALVAKFGPSTYLFGRKIRRFLAQSGDSQQEDRN